MTSKWQDQIAVGRVFELKSASKRFEPTCVLVIRDDNEWGHPMVAKIDRFGVQEHGYYRRRAGNPNINTYSLRRKDFTAKKIARRRPDLERFDARDIDLIRYGLDIDFTGKIGDGTHDIHLPSSIPCTWTVFWTRAEHSYNYAFEEHESNLKELMRGAWHFEKNAPAFWRYGWCHAWVTAHTCPATLRRIERLLRREYSDLERQTVRFARWHDWATLRTHTWQLDRADPIFKGMNSHVTTPAGNAWSYYSS